MATNIDKALYQAPMGLAGLDAQQEDPIEIEVVDPEEVNIRAGDTELSIAPDGGAGSEGPIAFDANLAEYMDEGDLTMLAGDLSEDIDHDRGSRRDWEKSYKTGLTLMGLQYEERTEPWDGACGVFHPMITEAVVRFQSETITETFPASGPVRTKIIGKETSDKKEAAQRVEADMNYQLTERMPEFRPEHEQMLWTLAGAGSAFKKVYYDPSLGRQVSKFVPPEDILLPYGVSDARSSYRVTHVMRKTKNEILKLQEAGFYRDIELGEPSRSTDDIRDAKDKETGFTDTNDDRYILLECHVDVDMPGFEDPSGIALPYVVTFIQGTNDVLAVRRNWEEDDQYKIRRQHFVQYQYIPGFGPYGYGLFHLVGGFAKSATSLLRQLVDAGTLSNLPGGLKSRGLRIKGDDTPIAPGEFRDVDVASGAIRDNILPLPYKEPSQVLAALLDKIVDEGRRFASSADIQVSDMSAQSPVGSTLAILERQLKVMTAVQARVHHSLKQEIGLIADIVRDYSDESYSYEPDVGTPQAKKSDYSDVDIIPVSDPNAATLAQRVVQFQAVWQMAQGSPDVYNMPLLHRTGLEIMGIKNAAKLVPLPEDLKPTDPVSENMAILKGEPVKAFIFQDHESHIKVHMAAAQDPQIMQLIGQNPKAQQIMGSAMAHIAEHAAFAYRQRIEQQLGMALPAYDDGEDDSSDMSKLPAPVANSLAQMMAMAAQQVLQQSKQQQAQQQAKQQEQDPLLALQKQELELKKQDIQIKGQKAQAEAQLKQAELELKKAQLAVDAADKGDRLELERQKVSGNLELEGTRLGADIKHKHATLNAQQEQAGVKIGAEIARNRSDRDYEARVESLNHGRDNVRASSPQPDSTPKKGPKPK